MGNRFFLPSVSRGKGKEPVPIAIFNQSDGDIMKLKLTIIVF